jgi:hypothetical protein
MRNQTHDELSIDDLYEVSGGHHCHPHHPPGGPRPPGPIIFPDPGPGPGPIIPGPIIFPNPGPGPIIF